MEKKILIAYPTFDVDGGAKLKRLGMVKVSVEENNIDVPVSPEILCQEIPSFSLTNAYGRTILTSTCSEDGVLPTITDDNDTEHVASPWILVPIIEPNSYVGGHPHYVPKPPAK